MAYVINAGKAFSLWSLERVGNLVSKLERGLLSDNDLEARVWARRVAALDGSDVLHRIATPRELTRERLDAERKRVG